MEVLIKRRNTATLFSFYESVPNSEPKSFRPISVLSHGRETIDSAVAKMINEQYKNIGSQHGFQTATGTETAIL